MLGLECWDGCVSRLYCPGAKLRPSAPCCRVRSVSLGRQLGVVSGLGPRFRGFFWSSPFIS